MPRISEILINDLKAAQELIELGNTAAASLIIDLVTARALVAIGDNIKSVEDKLLGDIDDQPMQLTPQTKRVISKASRKNPAPAES